MAIDAMSNSDGGKRSHNSKQRWIWPKLTNTNDVGKTADWAQKIYNQKYNCIIAAHDVHHLCDVFNEFGPKWNWFQKNENENKKWHGKLIENA